LPALREKKYKSNFSQHRSCWKIKGADNVPVHREGEGAGWWVVWRAQLLYPEREGEAQLLLMQAANPAFSQPGFDWLNPQAWLPYLSCLLLLLFP
jgi:hypothetical protein